MIERDLAREPANRATIQAAFDAWAAGTSGPFALLAPNAKVCAMPSGDFVHADGLFPASYPN